jgi:hypothetical protein
MSAILKNQKSKRQHIFKVPGLLKLCIQMFKPLYIVIHKEESSVGFQLYHCVLLLNTNNRTGSLFEVY